MNIEIEIINAVRALASKHYDEGYGWKVIIECMDDEEILVACEDTHDLKKAIRNIKAFVAMQDDA